MTEKQKIEAANFIAGWLDKLSVGCLVVGLFQPSHMVGGIIGSMVCFSVAVAIKIRRPFPHIPQEICEKSPP